jgi:hypothetical protein
VQEELQTFSKIFTLAAQNISRNGGKNCVDNAGELMEK